MYQLTKNEQNDIRQIENTYYMRPILDKFIDLNKKNKVKWIDIFNKIYEILKNSEK